MNPIKIGVLATLFGPFEVLGKDGIRGVEIAVDEFGGEIAGQSIELAIEGTLGLPDSTNYKAEDLIKKQRVDFIIGPLSGTEGLGIRDLAQGYPDRTFINGASGAQLLTLDHPSPNFYNFALTGTQCMAGLGRYAYEQLDLRRVVTLAENYSYPYAQIGGFMTEFCPMGGHVIEKLWVPLGTKAYDNVIAAIPDEADAIFVALGGTDAIDFLRQYEQVGGTKSIFGGAITTDQSVLTEGGLADYLLGIVTGGPTADDNPNPQWQDFVATYQAKYPDGYNYPSYFALTYYVNTKAALLALAAVEGDLSGGQAAFRAALDTMAFAGPSGPVRLDGKRGAITTNFITVVQKDENGVLYRHLLQEVDGVTTTLGLPEDEFLAMGEFTQRNPSCP
ncbi:MAG: ABC transporter substrate-binding protein [Anaerolineae bacterium]|nr:ABC transporter substrate-binding protein [Anaerolineae bacterium]